MREQEEQGRPVIRVWTLGEFGVERLVRGGEQDPRYEPLPVQEWQSRGAAVTLLKVLLCRAHRQASKQELMATIWPAEQEGGRHPAQMGRSFDAAASVLRAVLSALSGESLLLTRRRGEQTSYRLADQQRLWVDADACETLVNQAVQVEGQGARPEDAVAMWEEASRLMQRGSFLEEELHAPWSESRRQRIEGTRRLCVHHLADQYLALHRSVDAEVILRQFWTAQPSDEDALFRLMTLLAHQARLQEALQAFSYTERFLWKQEQRKPSTRLVRLAEQLRHAERS
jgi:DNA-binding SARP family transcriptional activator